jgi:hypothetical protein
VGYVPKRTFYKLNFSETEYDGLEVVTRSASMATLLAILELAEQAEDATSGVALKKLDELFGLFETVLESWNVETEKGKPVPATKAGLLTQDSAFVLAVIQMWGREMTQAPPTSPTASGPGATSVPEGLAEASRTSSAAQRF